MNLPHCPQKTCPAPRTILLHETPGDWQFGCETCRTAWVVVKPALQEASRRDAALKAQAVKHYKEREAERVVKFPPPKTWKFYKESRP